MSRWFMQSETVCARRSAGLLRTARCRPRVGEAAFCEQPVCENTPVESEANTSDRFLILMARRTKAAGSTVS